MAAGLSGKVAVSPRVAPNFTIVDSLGMRIMRRTRFTEDEDFLAPVLAFSEPKTVPVYVEKTGANPAMLNPSGAANGELLG
jgi:hypothetical protein